MKTATVRIAVTKKPGIKPGFLLKKGFVKSLSFVF